MRAQIEVTGGFGREGKIVPSHSVGNLIDGNVFDYISLSVAQIMRFFVGTMVGRGRIAQTVAV